MIYGDHARSAHALDAAVGRVRLGGMTLGTRELGGLARLRLLVMELNPLTFSSEAEAMAGDRNRRKRLELLRSLVQRGRLHVRIAPLAGWSPDFSVFLPPPGTAGPHGPVLMLGLHWFERPYPHPGPAFGVVLRGGPALRAAARFEELWASAHDLRGPVESLLAGALRRVPPPEPLGSRGGRRARSP